MADKSPPRPLLAGMRLFTSGFLSDQERDALERAALPPRPFRSGTDVVREGDVTGHLHFLIKGWACRYKTNRDGGRQIVGVSVPGDAANLDALMFDRLNYGVRTLTAASVVAIPRERVLELAEQHGGIARVLTWLALVDNAVLSEWALCLGRLSAHQRLAHLLCELATRSTVNEGNASVFELPLTQEQLADTLGLTSVHVNRMMQQLRGEQLIVTSGRLMTIPDMARLRDIGEFNPGYLHLEDGGVRRTPSAEVDGMRRQLSPRYMAC